MITKFIEVTNGPNNWGKFMVARFHADEWARRSTLDRRALLYGRGWTREHLLVVDLQTGEGAMFRPGGLAAADLTKRKIWVCPMFEPFLTWLYQQNLHDLERLPGLVDLLDAPFAMSGYRRPGPNRTCPFCGAEVDDDPWAEIAHMEVEHPAVIEARNRAGAQ